MSSVFRVRQLTGALGAEITGVDLRVVGQDTFDEIRRTCLEHSVLVFRGQTVEPSQQLAFTGQWGTPVTSPFLKAIELAGHPEIVEIRNSGKAQARTEVWHSESSFLPEPPDYTVLVAKELPECGGDTMFANQYRAYETLSGGLQELLGRLRAMHSPVKSDTAHKEDSLVPPPQSHPAVLTHPISDKRAMYLSPAYVYRFDGMTRLESQGFLDFLFRHITRPDFVYRHQWLEGDVLVWDNRCTLHYAVHDYGERNRVLHRTLARLESSG